MKQFLRTALIYLIMGLFVFLICYSIYSRFTEPSKPAPYYLADDSIYDDEGSDDEYYYEAYTLLNENANEVYDLLSDCYEYFHSCTENGYQSDEWDLAALQDKFDSAMEILEGTPVF